MRKFTTLRKGRRQGQALEGAKMQCSFKNLKFNHFFQKVWVLKTTGISIMQKPKSNKDYDEDDKEFLKKKKARLQEKKNMFVFWRQTLDSKLTTFF